jgi:hypothetical protein
MYDNSDASILRFRINDGRDSPIEPAYVETKASILRRRQTMKLMAEHQAAATAAEESSTGRFRGNKRHLSLNDVNAASGGDRTALLREEERVRKWKSVSNDELSGSHNDHHQHHKYSLSNTQRISNSELRASQVCQFPVLNPVFLLVPFVVNQKSLDLSVS